MSKYLNLQEQIYIGVGQYNIPQIETVNDIDISDWIGFNYVKSNKNQTENTGVHFFLDDYQFERVWNDPNRYIGMLKKYGAILSPDFSLYSDFPKAVQIYNHYRKHWLGAYWQENGITVIPTIAWSDKESYDWCFDGEPKGGIVAVSSVGTQRHADTKRLFLNGYEEMMNRLNPSAVMFFGTVPEECEGNIIKIAAFQDKFRKGD